MASETLVAFQSWGIKTQLSSSKDMSTEEEKSTSLGVVTRKMIDDGDCGAIGGMKIGRGNRSTRR
jgi:hypothetical protein